MQHLATNRSGRPVLAVAVICLTIWGAVACEKRNEYIPPPPPKVTVAQPLLEDVVDYLEMTGTTKSVEEVEVRARVAGFLESMHFTPGNVVNAGDLLFVIDPREYQAQLNATKAEVQSALAQLERAGIELARAEKLFAQNAGAEADVVKWRGERDVALAAVARARANLQKSQLDLDYTRVTAPNTGRAGRNLVDLGNLVGEKEPTLLTTVTRYDPIHVYFNLNERDLLKVLDKYRLEFVQKDPGMDSESFKKIDIPLFLGLADEEGYPHEGEVDYSESGVDPETGTIQLRGVFSNPGRVPELVPGLFARVRMPIEERKNAILVTERAVGSDQQGRYLLVVDGENTVEKRIVRMGQLVDGLRVIDEGIGAQDWVIVNGTQRARPGAKVDPQRIEMASLKTSALRAAAEAQKSNPPALSKPAAGAEPQK